LNEMMSAKIAPATTPSRIKGSVMRRKARGRVAPRPTAASSRSGRDASRLAPAVRIT
jgi:hypothetical protein